MSNLSNQAKAEIVCAILKGEDEAEEAFALNFVSDFDKILLRRQAKQTLRYIAKANSPIRGYFQAPIKNPMRLNFLVAAVIGLLSVAGLVLTFRHINWATPATYTLASAAAGFMAVAAATAGWTVSSWVAYRNTRVQQTITFVAHRFTHDTFVQQISIFNEHLKGQPVDTSLVNKLAVSNDPKDRAALQAIRYILNYFEFLSVGILSGNFDEEIIRKTMRGNFTFYYDRCMRYISECQDINPKALEHFTKMRAHFKDPHA